MGTFSIPKRERFNEEVDNEILSQKSNRDRVHSMLSSKSLVVKGDTTSFRSQASQRISMISSKKNMKTISEKSRFSVKSKVSESPQSR
jgi:hypothetical protein